MAGARAAFQRAIDSGHADQAPTAAFNLGYLLEKQGDLAGARAAYERAVKWEHAKVVGRAAFGLGMLLAEQGDAAGARAAFERAAIECGCADAAPDAARFFARLHRRRWPRLVLRGADPVVDRLRQRKWRGASHRIVRVRVPFDLEHDVGLGDALKWLTSKLGIEPCPACQERAAGLNHYVVFTGRPPAGP